MQKIQDLKLQKLRKYKIIDFAYTEVRFPVHFMSYHDWVDRGLNGSLSYLEGDRKGKRKDISFVFPEYKSALVFLFSHLNTKKYLNKYKDKYQIASFVLGYKDLDYHYFIKNSLTEITELYLSDVKTKICVDTSPILERDLAYSAGLGFFGKNSMLIHPQFGSHIMIGTILLDKKLDMPSRDIIDAKCGKCTSCQKLCPTNAIIESYTIEASKCISTYTIEEMKEIKAPKGYKNQKYYFGCDKCQDVCPFNIKALKDINVTKQSVNVSQIEDFFLRRDPLEVIEELESMSNNSYKKMFKRSCLERTGRVGMLKNLKALSNVS